MDYWFQIPDHYPYVKLDAFTLMPNHLHGVVKIEATSNENGLNKYGGQKTILARQSTALNHQ